MTDVFTNPKAVIILLFAALATVFILDYLIPGDSYTEKVTAIDKNLQRYNNAAQNYHFSFAVLTENHTFSVSEDFARQLNEGDEITFSVSPLFSEVNHYKHLKSETSESYILGIIAQLILPLLSLIVFTLGLKYHSKVGNLVFVFQVLLLADLVLLLN